MKKIAEAVDKNRELILKTQNYIWSHPETGYREKNTSHYLEHIFTKLGYDIIRAGDIPGFYTVFDTGRPGPEILVLGEMDSLLCETHPDADPKTGAVHCCGHSAQCAALVGVAAALRDPSAADMLCGRIRLCAVPAEELIEIEYRNELRRQGKIHYYGGKTEFLSRGYFDNADLAFMVHTTPGSMFSVNAGGVGCLAKKIIYRGKSAHAGGAPWNGRNALYAATLGLNAINALRETFREQDIIRVHPIITQGGTAVNAIPDTVILESYIRGSSFEAIRTANERVNRAICGSAVSLGVQVDIQDYPGYAPYRNDSGMIDVAEDALKVIAPERSFRRTGIIGSGSTDMGDISCVMPMIHPYAPGATGTEHGTDYRITDPETALVLSAKWQLTMLALLLGNGGERARQIKESYQPLFPSKEQYFAYLDRLISSGDRIAYQDDGNIQIHLFESEKKHISLSS